MTVRILLGLIFSRYLQVTGDPGARSLAKEPRAAGEQDAGI